MRLLPLAALIGVGGVAAVAYNGVPQELWPTSASTESTSTTVYKWRDKAGNWQFGDRPPAGVDHQVMAVKGVAVVASPATTGKSETKRETPAPSFNPLMPFTDPGAVKQLADDARNVGPRLEQRKADMDQAVAE